MNQKVSTKSATQAKAPDAAHPLLERPVPHAYALIPHPTRPGLFYAVHLKGVTAAELETLEPSARPEPSAFGLQRIQQAMNDRHYRKTWGA